MNVRDLSDRDRDWVAARTTDAFASSHVVSRGRLHHVRELQGVIAEAEGRRVGVATYRLEEGACEIVTIQAVTKGDGVGTALLAAVEERAGSAGCPRVWLVTTNDNLDALRFFQRRGYLLAALHPGIVDRSRRLKPALPELGCHGIPLRDELELEKWLP